MVQTAESRARPKAADEHLFVKCPSCGNTLGALAAGGFVVKHRGRELLLDRPPVSIRCEVCPGVWHRPDLTDAELMARVETEIRARCEGDAVDVALSSEGGAGDATS